MYGDNFITHFKDDIAEMFERRERDKGEKITAEIMEVDPKRIYPDDYDLPLLPVIKSYSGQLIIKKRVQSIIEFDDRISVSGRIGHK